jgi:predicted phage terminase large subunit-like protein
MDISKYKPIIIENRENKYNNIYKELPDEEQLNKVLCEKSLAFYTKQVWHIIENKKPYIWNWHLDAICEHLEAVTNGEINYLLINIPPRHTKSLIAVVIWPTWIWGPQRQAQKRFVTSSYAASLSIRDCRKSRLIIQSDWFREKWGRSFKLSDDQNAKGRYDNDKSGYRLATSVGGIGTGEGGDYIICDDPHNVQEAESELKRNDVLTWWDEAMSTRLDDEEKGAYIIIAQRTHHNDLCGHIIDKADAGDIPNLTKLILPARYEKERELKLQTRTPLDFKDPRTEEGEILDKNRFSEKKMKSREMRMTEYSRAGQLQQRPSPRGGGLFKVGNFKAVPVKPPWNLVQKAVRYWDKAATEGGGCLSAGVLMYEMKQPEWTGPQFIVADVVYGQWSSSTRNLRMVQEAQNDGKEVYVYTEQEPGSGGKESAEITVRLLAGYKVFADKVTGSKEIRAENYAAQVEVNNVGYVINVNWNKDFLDQHEHFPTGSGFKDIVDASSGAFNLLTLAKRKKAGTWGR